MVHKMGGSLKCPKTVHMVSGWPLSLFLKSTILIFNKNKIHFAASINNMLHFIVFIKHLQHKMCSQYTPPSLELILSLRVRLVASVPTAVFQHYLKTKVPFTRKAWGLRPKSHIILIEIKERSAQSKKEQPKTTGKKTVKI